MMILPLMLFVSVVYGAVDESSDSFEQRWLGDQQLRVLYLPKGGERFSVAFDVQEFPQYTEGHKDWQFVRPVLSFIKDESLRGCFAKKAYEEETFSVFKDDKAVCGPPCGPANMSIDFSLQDGDLAHYDLRPFYSKKLENFLQYDCPQVYSDSPSQASFHEGWHNLCGGTLQNMLLWWRTWQWSVENRKNFEEEVKDTDNQTRVFILVQGGSVLKGTMEMSFFSRKELSREKSFFDYKLEAVENEMQRISGLEEKLSIGLRIKETNA